MPRGICLFLCRAQEEKKQNKTTSRILKFKGRHAGTYERQSLTFFGDSVLSSKGLQPNVATTVGKRAHSLRHHAWRAVSRTHHIGDPWISHAHRLCWCCCITYMHPNMLSKQHSNNKYLTVCWKGHNRTQYLHFYTFKRIQDVHSGGGCLSFVNISVLWFLKLSINIRWESQILQTVS